jgi:DNA-binding IclR family transcriptional regulator
VDTALSIVDLVHEYERVTTSEVAEKLGKPTTTTSYHLRTLANEGVLAKDGGAYELGPRLLKWGGGALSRHPLRRVTDSHIVSLSREVNEVAFAGVRYDDEACIVNLHAPTGTAESAIELGEHIPLHATAVGKVLLSELETHERHRWLADRQLEQFTPNTITDASTLTEALDRVRADGVAFDDEEYLEGLRSVATPISRRGAVVGALGVIGTPDRIYGDRKDEEIPHLLEQRTRRIEEALQSDAQ